MILLVFGSVIILLVCLIQLVILIVTGFIHEPMEWIWGKSTSRENI